MRMPEQIDGHRRSQGMAQIRTRFAKKQKSVIRLKKSFANVFWSRVVHAFHFTICVVPNLVMSNKQRQTRQDQNLSKLFCKLWCPLQIELYIMLCERNWRKIRHALGGSRKNGRNKTFPFLLAPCKKKEHTNHLGGRTKEASSFACEKGPTDSSWV